MRIARRVFVGALIGAALLVLRILADALGVWAW